MNGKFPKRKQVRQMRRKLKARLEEEIRIHSLRRTTAMEEEFKEPYDQLARS